MSGPRVVIVGGGIIGLSSAWRLAQAGCPVTLLDAAPESREASWAAAGMLAPHHEADGPGPLWMLGRLSLEKWPGFVAELVQDPAAVDFRMVGGWMLELAGEDPILCDRKQAFLAAAGVDVHRLGRHDLADSEPELGSSVRGALKIPAGQVNPRLVVMALHAACLCLGVQMRFGAQALRIDDGRVDLADGTSISGDVVVLASGAWTPDLARLSGISLGGEPVKGQMLRLGSSDGLLRHFIHCHHAYLVPRAGNGIVIGSTMVADGFDKREDPAAIMQLVAEARALVPALADAAVMETWTGLRPRITGGLPLIDRVSPRLIIATGHFRNGILLAPITGEAVSALVMQVPVPQIVNVFSLSAFQVRP